MHRHDLDLIAEYAQGALADPTRARALVESCEQCEAEFELQQSMMATMAGVAPASMSAQERAALHRDLWTELRNPVATSSKRGAAWWSAWALGGATVLFIAVGLSGVLSSQDATTGTFSEIGSSLNGGSEAPPARSETEDGAEVAAETTSTAATDTDTANTLESTDAYAAMATDVRSADASALYAFDGEAEEKARLEKSECLVEAGLEEFSVVTGFEGLTDLIIAIPVEPINNGVPVAFVDPETCSVVHMEE